MACGGLGALVEEERVRTSQSRGKAQSGGRAEAARRQNLNFWGGRWVGKETTQEALGRAGQYLGWRGCVCVCGGAVADGSGVEREKEMAIA